MNSTSSVRQTSRDAHYDHVISGRAKYQREVIMEFMERHQLPRNRREIALMTGLKINAVTGRVNCLVKSGKLIEEHYCIDPITNQRVWYVEIPYKVILAAPVIQARLF